MKRLLVRSEYYAEDDEQRREMAGEAELFIAKQRNGPVGEVPLTFLKEFTRIEDQAREAFPLAPQTTREASAKVK